ncbi:DUF2335 domain-containing protein [Companilactobacillus allii]|uniref:DUF2335 domain-containing protein n=2 Tax=Companilactobacillus allii TaxID=1847728 RepID=A0A1P8Q650_9LACO|nr:DUF2335 domain-containing protein [Companilactobacillus allii]APX73337.1 hypothetical protein BTM29_05775 [Companilactobacillus allii]USQ69194.1 DUF2335 domain-containing protein [Companilactobacillus allii]
MEHKENSTETDDATVTDNADESTVNSEIKATVDNFEKLAPKQREQVISKLEMYSGPIPHPDILKKYDDMYNGAAQEIIDNGVQESVHRRSMESEYLKQNTVRNRRRDWMGFLIGTLGIVFGFYLLYLGHTVVGSIFSGGTLVTLVSVFASNNNSESSEEEDNDGKDSEN